MKTIEEKAKEYAAKCHCQNTEWGFIAGAQSEHEELTRWHDPKEELPDDGQEVLGIIDEAGWYAALLHFDRFGWWIRPSPTDSWAKCPYDVIKWRYIQNNKL